MVCNGSDTLIVFRNHVGYYKLIRIYVKRANDG